MAKSCCRGWIAIAGGIECRPSRQGPLIFAPASAVTRGAPCGGRSAAFRRCAGPRRGPPAGRLLERAGGMDPTGSTDPVLRVVRGSEWTNCPRGANGILKQLFTVSQRPTGWGRDWKARSDAHKYWELFRGGDARNRAVANDRQPIVCARRLPNDRGLSQDRARDHGRPAVRGPSSANDPVRFGK